MFQYEDELSGKICFLGSGRFKQIERLQIWRRSLVLAVVIVVQRILELLIEMEGNQRTPSVIARLMGLDELPPQQPIHKHIRVLSEDYLQKTASIGLVKNRSSYKGHSSRRNISKQQEFKDAFGTQIPKYRNNEIGRKSDKTTYRGNILRSLQKLERDFDIDSFGRLDISPTSIVVPKQKFWKAQNAARSSLSPTSDVVSQLGDRKNKEFPTLSNGGPYNLVTGRKNSANGVEPSRHDFRVSRGIAKKTAQKFRNRFGSNSTEVSRPEFRISNTSANESVVMMLSCPSFFDGKNQDQISYSSSNRLSLANEDNKQLFEPWKMTKSFQVGAPGRSCTLSEIFAIPDQETRARNLNCELDEHGPSSQFNMIGGNSDLATPLGTNSMDGWKAENVRNLPKSRPPPTTCNTTEMPVSTTRSEASHRGWHLRREEAITGGESKLRKQSFYQKYGSNMRDSNFSFEGSESGHYMDLENKHNIQEVCTIFDELKTKPEEKYFCEESSLVFKLSIDIPCSNSVYNHQGPLTIQDELENSYKENDVPKDSEHNSRISNPSVDTLASLCMVADVIADRKTENVGFSSGISEEQQSGSAPCILLAIDVNTSHVWDAPTGQKSFIASPPSNCTKKDPEFPMSSADPYYASPNSVLEPSFEEDNISGPECFEILSTDLNGLWMQLQLLKSESEDTHSEGSGLAVSSDGDTGKGFFDPADKKGKFRGLFRAEESRDFSYLVDVLDEAGFQGGNLEMCFETWYSPEFPMSPSVFEALEKKYGKQTSWEKSERMRLFDRINAGLMEILNPCMDGYMWAKPLRRQFSSLLRRDAIEEELWMLLISQEKEVSKDLFEKALGRDMRWLDLGEDISVICTEIEKLLLDELAVEFASSLSI